MVTKEEVIEVLKTINDPEIPVDIVNLGLIYEINIAPDSAVEIKMTLTAVGCPMSLSINKEVTEKIKAIPGVSDCKVEIIWDPPWSPARMSQEAKLKLGFVDAVQ